MTTLLLDKEAQPVDVQGRVDLVLSPSLYWFRSEALPVKTVFQARKLAPSVFDAIVPEGIYSYHVLKRDDTFWLFAYNEEQIIGTIARSGIRPTDVRHLYFAQTECAALETPLRLGGTRILSSVDGVVTELPARYAADAEDARHFFESHARQGPAVGITLYHSALLDKKQFKRLSIVAAVFALLYGIEYFTARAHLASVLEEQEKIAETYRLPQTSFERNGLISALEKKQKRQTRLRETAKALFDLPADAENHLERLTLTPRNLTVSAVFKEPAKAEAFKKALMNIGTISSDKRKGDTLYLEVAYE
ncbi:hypothetical protein LOH54_10895 [Sulfurimonas sp. HSL-3221]|uniref:hypothetical protein n=1 Tax=Thiomicrolovo sulfuroxydans TaxID=2894755 RepID=UPI001E3D8868|nr:hypothetical protein [Sulfurimonas sp. HSL-3221]UFS62152.1 hypothetical protein LOH54_10895 [Sulfurimonas sp. HSL-3221]